MANGVLFHEAIFATTVESGDKIYFYETATTTEINVYTDGDLTTLHTQPIVANSSGRFAAIYLSPSLGDLKVKLTDSDDVEKYTVDPYPLSDTTTLSSDLATAEADIVSLKGRVTAAESDIDTNNNDIASLDSRVDSLEGVSGTVTESDFTGSSQSKTSSGWQDLPGGIILQWGSGNISGNELEESVTFPKEFPTSVMQFIVSGGVSDIDQTGTVGISHTTPTTTTGYVANSDDLAHPYRWFAIGY